MQFSRQLLCVIGLMLAGLSWAADVDHNKINESLPAVQLKNFKVDSPTAKQLIAKAYTLAHENLRYQFGSDDPKRGGMDCSGTISYLLKSENIHSVPRQADEIYKWAWEKGHFYAVNGHTFHSFEFSQLKPGDLLFWSDTYKVHRDPPVTHVMLYLGKDRHNQPLMFGASEQYEHNGKVKGVNVFDFTLVTSHSSGHFLGYSCIPGLTCNEKSNSLHNKV